MKVPPPDTKRVTVNTGKFLDNITARQAGSDLTGIDAQEALFCGTIPLVWSGEGGQIGAARANAIRDLGLTKLIARHGDITQLQRRLGISWSDAPDALPSKGSVADVAKQLGISVSSQVLIDRARGSDPATIGEIDARIAQAQTKVRAVMERLEIDGDLPTIETAKLPEAKVPKPILEQREVAWDLYKKAKGSMDDGIPELAEAQLELAAAHNLKFLALAKDEKLGAEVMRAQNRIGMIVHQFGLLAKGRGDEETHESNQVKALRWYSDVTSAENVDHYHPAAFMNAACAYAQLGDHDRGLRALQDMLAACGDSAQVESMKKNAREDLELLTLYSGNQGFNQLVDTMTPDNVRGVLGPPQDLDRKLSVDLIYERFGNGLGSAARVAQVENGRFTIARLVELFEEIRPGAAHFKVARLTGPKLVDELITLSKAGKLAELDPIGLPPPGHGADVHV